MRKLSLDKITREILRFGRDGMRLRYVSRSTLDCQPGFAFNRRLAASMSDGTTSYPPNPPQRGNSWTSTLIHVPIDLAVPLTLLSRPPYPPKQTGTNELSVSQF